MTYENTPEALLAAGFTRRRVREYLAKLDQEDHSPLFADMPKYRAWCHQNGFTCESACAYRLSEENIGDYLSDYDIYRLWPINSWQRVWINDKLTLKYMLAGTELDQYLPKYYFYSDGAKLLPLIDSGLVDEPDPNAGVTTPEEFLAVLREKGEFACKPCNGVRGAGFHKLSYADGNYYVDNVLSDAAGVERYLKDHPNDLYTEFFHPGNGMEKVSPVIHTVRVLVINETGRNPIIAGTYMRLATDVAGDDSKSNFDPTFDDLNKAQTRAFHVILDPVTGHFGTGRLIYGNKIEDSPCFPDTGELCEGYMKDWDKARDMIIRMSQRLSPVENMGFDVCMTDDGPKVIEINSDSGIKYLQSYTPLMSNPVTGPYYRRKLEQLAAMSEEQLARRRETAR